MPPTIWKCIGTEVVLGDRRADLLFEHNDGSILVAELKTGGHHAADKFEDTNRQCRDTADAARDAYGDKLFGFAEIYILVPHLSKFWLGGDADAREPLTTSKAWPLDARIVLPAALDPALDDL